MNTGILVGFMTALLIMPIGALGLGIASDYLEDNVYKIEEGITHAEYGIRLQNMDESEKTVSVIIEIGADIVSIRDYEEQYVLAPESTENSLIMDILIPSTARVGDTYEVSYSVRESISGQEQVVFGTALTKSFTIEIVSSGEGTVIQQRDVSEANFNYDYILYAVIIIIAVIMLFKVKKSMIKKFRKKKK